MIQPAVSGGCLVLIFSATRSLIRSRSTQITTATTLVAWSALVVVKLPLNPDSLSRGMSLAGVGAGRGVFWCHDRTTGRYETAWIDSVPEGA